MRHIGLSFQEEKKKQGQNDSIEKGKGFTLAVGWEDSEIFPEGLILKLRRQQIPSYWM